MFFVALDLGTSFIKGAVLDLDTLGVRHIQRTPFPLPLPGLPPLLYEIDPRQIVAATRDLIAQLLPHAPSCSGLVLCSQMQSLVLCGERGEPLSNYISWRDQRALLPHPSGQGNYFDVLARRISPDERQRLGNELKPSLPVCALFWLNEQGQLPARAIPASLGDFVLAHLCGSTPGIEATNASVQGVFDLPSRSWHRDVLTRLGLDALDWPRVCAAGEVVGWLDLDGQRLPCYTPVGDQQCALAGTLLQEGELSINISTGSQVSLLSPRLALGHYQTRPFFDGQYLNLITHIPAGRSLSALVNLLTEVARAQHIELDPWPYLIDAAERAGETDLGVNLAFFAGPCGDRGEIANLREENLTAGHLFRAAFQNMADNYHACALRLSPEQAWERLVFSGGLAHIALLRKIICTKFGSKYRLCPSSEDTLTGLLALALVFSGHAPSVEQAVSRLANTLKSA